MHTTLSHLTLSVWLTRSFADMLWHKTVNQRSKFLESRLLKGAQLTKGSKPKKQVFRKSTFKGGLN